MQTESPSPQPPADPSPPAAQTADWWASSEPAPDTAPSRSQSTEMQHPLAPEGEAEAEDAGEAAPTAPSLPAVADATPLATEVEATPPAQAPVVDSTKTPTAPYHILTMERAAAILAVGAEPPPAPIVPLPPVIEPFESTQKLAPESAPAISAFRSRQGLAAMAARDIGRVRQVNQDSVFSMITTLPREDSEVVVGLFMVADGMGGHQGGEVASRLAVRTVVHHVMSQLILPALDERMDDALQPMLVAAVQSANEAIWDSAQVMGSDMGTTCTAVLLVGGSLYLAHVGDSRAYLFEPGGLRQLSVDHSTVGRLIQLGQLDPSEAREHPLRNQLYRTVGQQPQVMVDFVYQPVGQSSHLLLCSDGLWGLVNEPLLEQALTRSPWPQDACNELIALANLAGGDDNISAVVVSLPLLER